MAWKDTRNTSICAGLPKAIRILSLTCRDGAVSGVVVKSVKVLAALWTEIKRTWNMEEADCEDLQDARTGHR